MSPRIHRIIDRVQLACCLVLGINLGFNISGGHYPGQDTVDVIAPAIYLVILGWRANRWLAFRRKIKACLQEAERLKDVVRHIQDHKGDLSTLPPAQQEDIKVLVARRKLQRGDPWP